MPDNSPTPNTTSRRGFLRDAAAASTVAAAASWAQNHALGATSGVHSGADETLKIGLVGCGGRGTGAVVDALSADKNSRLVSVGDTFVDRARQTLEAVGFDENVADRATVSEDHIFTGFDAYKQVIDSGIDVVLLCTPPHFRAEHFEYAIAKGKHCFVEKPVATDIPSLRRVAQTCEVAKTKGLSVVSGLCWRYDPGVRETIQRIQDGAIGDIIAIESSYNTNTLWHRGDNPDWSRMEYQVRNWLYYTWLSGDIICEQAIHSLDKTAWLLGDAHPTQAMGIGGRQQRIDPKYGNVFDHFTVFYEYPGGQHVYFTCRQQDGCSLRVEERVLGTKGSAEVLAYKIEGANPWQYKGPKPSMYRVEHEEMFRNLRAGTPLNNGDYMVNSTMISILGRMASYTGKTLTWDQANASTERLGPAQYAWGDLPEPDVAIPGVTAFA